MLSTDRLTLRKARQSDLSDLNVILGDPRAMRYWSTPPHPDLATTQIQLDGMTARSEPTTYFMLEHAGRVIGMAGMHSKNEVGFILHPDFWRQGFLTEAMQAILPYLWQVTDNDHLFADADPRNAASVGLLLSLGFHETHRAQNTFCVNGEWSDSVYFRLNRPITSI